MIADPFAHTDGAYVLGALDDAERMAFEAHLDTCADCRDRVAEARSAAALLAGITVGDLAEPGPVPDTLLPGLLRAAGRERSRRRALIVSLGVAVAASVAALVVVLWPGSPASGPAQQAFAAVRPSPVIATAQVVDRRWGTEIELHCRYTDPVERYVPYKLVVIDKLNNRYPAGSWTLEPGHETDFTGGTAVQRPDIARVEITLSDGTPILQLNL